MSCFTKQRVHNIHRKVVRFVRWTPPIMAACLGMLVSVAWAQRNLSNIPIPDPQVELDSFDVAEGFEVNLYAADPLIAKPIQINFDAAGRLWVATSEVYPQIAPGQEANDKILVLEDVDHDGRADKTTVFAEGLLIPTGVEPSPGGGAYVAHSTELLYLADTDGDGHADRRQVVLSGFGTEDTHHILHTLRWGYDGCLYMNQSIYIHSHIETPHGVRRLNAGGIWRFRPETLELEVFTRGLVNPWGHHFDRFGQSFGTDGAGGEGINYLVPDAYYVTAADARRILHGLNPGSPKHCGLEIASGTHLPPEWQGNALTNDFRANRVCRFVLREEGAGFTSREQPELIRARNVAFRPVDIKLGPDGAIYIADWYNPIIQHGEVDFRDARRDHVHGRIWRVTAKGRPLVVPPNLEQLDTPQLIEQLASPEAWVRHHTRLLLKWRGPQAVAKLLDAWVSDLPADDPQADTRRLEALWTYQALNLTRPSLLDRLLESNHPRIRAAATRVLRYWCNKIDGALSRLEARIADDHPRVRLEALCALRRVARPEAAEIATRVLDHPMDTWLDYALWQTLDMLAPQWLPAVREAGFDFAGNDAHLTFALASLDRPQVVDPLVRLLREHRVPEPLLERALSVVARHGAPDQLAFVFDMAVESTSLPIGRRVRLLQVLLEPTRRRGIVPAGDLTRLVDLIQRSDATNTAQGPTTEPLRLAAVRAAGAWRVETAVPVLVDLLNAADTAPALRQAAAVALVEIQGAAARQTLVPLAGPDHAVGVRAVAVAALSRIDLDHAARLAASLLSQATAEFDPAPLIRAFLGKKDGPARLAAALASRRFDSELVRRALNVARSQSKRAQPLIEVLEGMLGSESKREATTPEQLAALVRRVQQEGDPARGEQLFRRADLACLKCHAIAGSGGRVGPDLISIGASAPVDYLIESLIRPNKAIKENYHAWVVTTDEGRVYSGIKVAQTNEELVLRTADDQEIRIAVDSIDEQSQAASLMPAGLADRLTDEELADLVRFLSELGRTPRYSIVPGQRVVRTWRVLQNTEAAIHLLRRTRIARAAQDDPHFVWLPAYSRVDGSLPLGVLPVLRPRRDFPSVGIARFRLLVTTPGEVELSLGSVEGLQAWADGQPLEIAPQIRHTFSVGEHTICFAVDLDERREPLRCEIRDVPGSPAEARPLGGK